MQAERWKEISRILEQAIECDPATRKDFLDQACASDQELRGEVEALLASFEQAGSFIEAPAAQIAAPLLASDQGRLEAGRVFGFYEIVRHLGSGGMGEVYLARDTRLERHVALKLLPAHFSCDAERVRRFVYEARAASALNHPNIITVHDIGRFDDRHFIATEYVEGATLRERIAQGVLTPHEAIEIAAQVACALARAHESGIIHRDIKPDNIILCPDERVKVLDFGLAKRAASINTVGDVAPSLHTAPGMILGTTAYMSPEQARGLETDSQTDIWSLGVTLYETLAGSLPFRGATNSDLLVAILDREPIPFAPNDAARVPARLRQIIAGALAKDKNERTASAREMEIALRQLQSQSAAGSWLETSNEFALNGDLVRAPASPATGKQNVSVTQNAGRAARSIRTRTVALATLIIFILSVSAYFGFYLRSEQTTSLAVLPFVHINADSNLVSAAEQAYLADGVTESVINSLSQTQGLRVIARSSVFRYQGREAEPRTVGRELDVRAVLVGRIVQRADVLVISAELVDASDHSRLWGERYERRISELVNVPREIAHRVSASLRLPTTGDEQQRVARRYTANGEAYRLYLLGRFHLNKRTESGFRTSIEHFNQALLVDPTYALAHAGLADAYQLLANYSVLTSRDAYPRAKASAERALELDDTLAEAHASLAKIAFDYEWDWARAGEEFERAIALSPNYAPAHQWYGGYLMALGRFDQALVELNKAQELDPLSLIINSSKGMIFFYDKQYDAAIEQFRKPLDVDPNFFLAHAYLGFAYGEKKMYREAIAEYERAIELSGGNINYIGGALGYTYGVANQKESARKLLTQLLSLSEHTHVAPSDIAKIYIGLGQHDEALAWLDIALQTHSYGLQYANVDPHYNSLRSDKRFINLLRSINPAFVP